MFHGTRPGWIEVISGVMFAGKSEELIRRVRRSVIARKKVQVFKSHLDNRYGGIFTISSLVHHDHAVGHLERLLLVVGHEDAGETDLVVQPPQPPAQLLADLGVE